MSRSEDFFSRDSRFDAWWGGPYDPEALEYARTHEGVNFNHPGTENTDLNAVRRYNIASNQETERLHAQDTAYFTGTDGFHIRLDGEWYLGTRGKKWRTVIDYSSKLMELIIKPNGNLKRLAKGEAALVFEYPEIPDMLSTRIAAEAQRCIVSIRRVDDQLLDLGGTLQAETQANWDWKTGLEDQWEKWKAFKRGYNDDILDIMIGWIAEVKALKSGKEQEEFDTEYVRAVASSFTALFGVPPI